MQSKSFLPGDTPKESALLLCFGFQLASLGLLRQTPSYSLYFEAIEGFPSWALWLARVLSVLTLAAVIALYCADRRLPFRRPFLLGASAALLCGTALMLYGSKSLPAYVLSQVLIGIGHAWVLAFWALKLSTLRRAQRNKCVALSALLAVLVFSIMKASPSPLQGALFLAIVAASCIPLASLRPSEGLHPDERPSRSGRKPEDGRGKPASLVAQPQAALAAVPAAFFVLMASYAVLFRMLVFFDFPHADAALSELFASLLRIAGMTVLAVYLARRHFCPSVRQIMVPLLFLTFVGVALLPFQGPLAGSLSVAIVHASWTFFYTIVWIALFEIGRAPGRDPLLVFLCGWTAMNTLLLVAAPVAVAFKEQLGSGALSMTALALVLVYTLSVGLLLLRKGDGGDGFPLDGAGSGVSQNDPSLPGAAEPSEPTWREERAAFYRRLAETHGLTPREAEVFELLVQGYSLPAVEERFFLSHSTVKGHARSIYRKFAVGSKQELIELVGALLGESTSAR